LYIPAVDDANAAGTFAAILSMARLIAASTAAIQPAGYNAELALANGKLLSFKRR
jgi:hypothetical protein